MPVVKPVNNAKRLTVTRNGATITLEAGFGDGSTKSATISVADLQQLGPGVRLNLKGVTLSQRQYKLPEKQRGFQCVSLYFSGPGSDLVIVSAAELRRAARITS